MRIGRQSERAADDWACRFPLDIGQQIGPRIDVSPARAGKHVAPVNCGLQMAEHAEGEGANIDAAVFLHDVTLPGLVDDFTGRIVVRLLAVLLSPQPIAGGEQRPTRRRRFEADVCEHMG